MNKFTDRYPTQGDLILVLNCGSSSIKFAIFDTGQNPLPRTPVWNGKVQGVGRTPTTFGQTGMTPQAISLDPEQPYDSALAYIRERLLERLDGRRLHAVAHRVVHGGNKYFSPVRVNADTLADLKHYIPLAPLHQPFALEAIDVLLRTQPDLVQIACFDTAFHHDMPKVEQMLPLTHQAWERGMRRYGFHGLSYDYLSVVLPERLGEAARGRVIAAHLGSGASLCAMKGLRSVATTMGFSALDGLMMGTRCGALDPGAVIYLMQTEKLSLEDVIQVLYSESGLLGLSGVSADPPELFPLEDQDNETGARVRDALNLYVHRIVRETGALAAVLGGMDALVFTAGIGEHSAEIRKRVCRDLAWLGIEIDPQANERNDPIISRPTSRITVAVEPTNEEWIAARQAFGLL
ncbi:acetate/propionate family kinase [Alcaligenaceae bacterium CGII-47]|nr:acetate/propionate family kinase [Alcaligenaceae bacterium CGII-47]